MVFFFHKTFYEKLKWRTTCIYFKCILWWVITKKKKRSNLSFTFVCFLCVVFLGGGKGVARDEVNTIAPYYKTNIENALKAGPLPQ